MINGAVVQSGDSQTLPNQSNTWKVVWNKGFLSLASGVNGAWNQVLNISGNSLLLMDILADKDSQRLIFSNTPLIADGYYEVESYLGCCEWRPYQRIECPDILPEQLKCSKVLYIVE